MFEFSTSKTEYSSAMLNFSTSKTENLYLCCAHAFLCSFGVANSSPQNNGMESSMNTDAHVSVSHLESAQVAINVGRDCMTLLKANGTAYSTAVSDVYNIFPRFSRRLREDLIGFNRF